MSDGNAEIVIERFRSALDMQRIDDAVGILFSLHPVDRADVFLYYYAWHPGSSYT